MITPFSPLLSLPDDHLPYVLSYLTLKDGLHLRLVCVHFREVTFESTHYLWMGNEKETTSIDGRGVVLSSRRMGHLLTSFPKLRAMQLVGLRLSYDQLDEGQNGAVASPRYICALLQEAECAQNLECLELLDVSESQTVSGEWGAASTPSYSLHCDIELEKMRKLTIEGSFTQRENPLVHSILRASHQITHLNLIGCSRLNDYDFEEAIMKPLSNTLTRLNLSGSGIQRPIIHSKVLKTLILQRCINLWALDPESFCPSLGVLDLSACPRFEGDGMLNVESGLTEFCPHLVTLDLSNCTFLSYLRINSPTLAKVKNSIRDATHEGKSTSPVGPSRLTGSSRLENINLSKCVSLSNVTISCPLKIIDFGECHNLKVLSITSPYLEMLDLSRLPLALISISCPSLWMLSLAWCRELDSKHSIIKCQALESVDIEGATYFTPQFFNDPNRKCNLLIRGHKAGNKLIYKKL